MSHEILEKRFIAVREPAWHRIGTTFAEPIPPSQAVELAGLDLGAETLPLFGKKDDVLVPTDLISVGRFDEGRWVSYGIGSKFTVLPLKDLLPTLDSVHQNYPLDAAGTLKDGGEVFFTFKAPASVIAGEEYEEYLVFRHSYTPGVAETVMWTPVRVVCRNTLVFGSTKATSKIDVAHLRNVGKMTTVALKLFEQLKRAQEVRARLEALTKKRLKEKDVSNVLDAVYAPYSPTKGIDLDQVGDLMPTEEIDLVRKRVDAQKRYVDLLKETTLAAFERFNVEHPALAGSAYALYQSVVEAADFRKGRDSMAESAVVGTRATEKARAWNLLVSMN